jgi:hypothetical protein
MFLMFCLHYADISEDVIPRIPGVYNMMRMCEEQEILSLPDEHLARCCAQRWPIVAADIRAFVLDMLDNAIPQ